VRSTPWPRIKYDDYVTMSTISKAMSIGGERGGAIRDAPGTTGNAASFREGREGRFINPVPKACAGLRFALPRWLLPGCSALLPGRSLVRIRASRNGTTPLA
jgi:hypothetical protein